MNGSEVYAKSLSREFRFLTTWPPDHPIEVGMIVKPIGNGVFEQITDLRSQRIPMGRTTASGEGSYTYSSSGAVSMSIKTGAELPAEISSMANAKAALEISFSRANAVAFSASRTSHIKISDEQDLERKVVRRMRMGKWERQWYVVTHVVSADSTTALVSGSSDSAVSIALGADAEVAGLELLNAELSPRLARQHKMETALVAGSGTPLFRAKRVKRRFFVGRPELVAGYAVDHDALDQADPSEEKLEEIILIDRV